MIAITGGPCAGKTTALEALRSRFARRGVRALFVPEAATDLILEGIAPWTCASMLEFQTRVIALQLEREADALSRAAAERSAVVVCDRGICDSRAYLTEEDYLSALKANGLDRMRALSRYDAVFHLESVAKSNRAAYTRDNNDARFENADEAVFADKRTLDAWSGHSSLHVIGNRPDFAEKVDALMRGIVRVGGVCGLEDPEAVDAPLLVSACLLGEPCRYDGKSKPCAAVIAMAEAVTFVPVCPEQLGGLPTPRIPAEIQADGRIVDAEGVDRTAEFRAGAREALRIAQEHGCVQAILKENSPSCGPHRIYDGTFSGVTAPGSGVMAALLAEAGIQVLSELDCEGSL